MSVIAPSGCRAAILFIDLFIKKRGLIMFLYPDNSSFDLITSLCKKKKEKLCATYQTSLSKPGKSTVGITTKLKNAEQ